MTNIKNIAIIAGGDSSEYEVSRKSARGLLNFIDSNRYNLYAVVLTKENWVVEMADGCIYQIDKNDFSITINGVKTTFDYAYITIHGRPGEDGRLQGYFDLLGIPYSSCGVLAGAMTFNKYVNNQFLKSQGVRVSDSIRLKKGRRADADAIVSRLGLPVFVKPNDGGSSFGVTKVKAIPQLQAAVEKAFAEGGEVIIERFVEGREVTCGCYRTRSKTVVFPITEIVTDNEFFDYDAKYNGKVREITPARLSGQLTERIQQETLRIYDLVDARGIIRIDYIIPKDNNPVLLEINTAPGMTEASLIPQQIRAAGLDAREVMSDIIEDV